MKYIYTVMVHTIGKNDFEEVKNFDSEKVAFKYTEELRWKNKIGLEGGHAYHF